jgi:hypothetical protein
VTLTGVNSSQGFISFSARGGRWPGSKKKKSFLKLINDYCLLGVGQAVDRRTSLLIWLKFLAGKGC